MTDKVSYEELTPREFRARLVEAPVAYLPLGTLEWHGEHLPLGADGIQSRGFFGHLARRVGGIVMPMLFLGPDRMIERDGGELYGMEFGPDGNLPYPEGQLDGSAYWISDEGFGLMLDAIMKQLARAGFRVVVGHGHGPSTHYFAKHREEWRERYGLITMDCWGGPDDWEGYGIQVDHAAMNETSLVMALRPDLVQMGNLPADTGVWPRGIGGRDPRLHANPELGKSIIDKHVDRMEGLIRSALEQVRQ